MRRFKFQSSILLCGLVYVLGSCASTNMHHLAVTNYADRTIVPDNRVAQWALTPVLIPTTILTLAVDNFIVAPVVHLPSAGSDAYDFITEPIDGYYSRMGLSPFQVLLTPVVFVGSWVGRSFFAIDTDADAAWTWPEWGHQWRRDDEGRLIGPPDHADTGSDADPEQLEPPPRKSSEDPESGSEEIQPEADAL